MIQFKREQFRAILYLKRTLPQKLRKVLSLFSDMAVDQMLLTEQALEKSMDEIETAHFHEVILIIKLKYSVAKFRSNFLPYDK